ncbi:MAG: beta strand repeat-containing protein [Nitrosopumilaceae archaeon]
MNNEIGRKITSLTLMTIMIAGGMTFALPGAIPVAHAQANANLFVSVEESFSPDRFGGAMVVEVVINDPDLKDTDEAETEPDVTVNGKDLRMVQATDGNWYAYFNDINMARNADRLSTLQGTSLDYGRGCTTASATAGVGLLTGTFSDSEGVYIDNNFGSLDTPGTLTACAVLPAAGVANTTNVVREPKTPTPALGATVKTGQIGIDNNAWPFIQLYSFSAGGDAKIVYNIGGGSPQTVTLEFDDALDDHATTSKDRTNYPQGADVHLTISDNFLNVDPTDEDSWSFGTNNTNGGNLTTVYQAFDENGVITAGGNASTGTPNLQAGGNLTTINAGDLGVLKIDYNPNNAVVDSILDLFDNADQAITEAIIPANVTANVVGSSLGRNNAPVTVVETEASSGIFQNTDESDKANIRVATDAPRGTTATVDYNDSPTSILVSNFFGTINMDESALGGEWNSGEELPVLLTDQDTNLNSKVDEDITLSNPRFTIIPSLKIGTPRTLNDGGFATLTNTPAIAGFAAVPAADLFSGVLRPSVTVSQALPISATGLVLNVTYANPPADFDPGTTNSKRVFLNYDIRSFANVTANAPFVVRATNATIEATGSIVGTVTLVPATTDYQQLVDVTPFANSLAGPNVGGTNPLHISFNFTLAAAQALSIGTYPIAVDVFSFGTSGDGNLPSQRFNNAIYRLELEETGDNTGQFEGTVEYIMLNQINVNQTSTYTLGIDSISDEAVIIVGEDLTDEDSPRINYRDLGADGSFTPIADQQEAPTHSGVVSFGSSTYKIADTVEITLEDQDLNTDVDTIDIFTVVSTIGDAAFQAVGTANYGINTAGEPFGRLLDVTFDDKLWTTDPAGDKLVAPVAGECAPVDATNSGLLAAGFSLVEQGAASGIFKGDFIVPADYCNTDGTTASTTGVDLEVNYVDFRDASGEIIEVGDGAGIRANTGSVSLDRTVYPVPWGTVADFGGTTGTSTTSLAGGGKAAIFPIHATGVALNSDGPEADGATGVVNHDTDTLGNGDVVIHIRVNDPDFDISASGEDIIGTLSDRGGTDADILTADEVRGPVLITISRGSDKVVLATAGGPVAVAGKITVLNATVTGELNAADGQAATTRELGPITEIAPDAGIFEIDVPVRYTDGPSSATCPTTVAFTQLDGTTFTGPGNRFTDNVATHCILQGDILTVEYKDPTDASGDPNTVTDSATFDLRNGVLQSDKSVYIIGADMILTVIEPDWDRDNDGAETYDLDAIEWDSDAATVTMGNAGGQGAQFDPEPSSLRETGDSTGIFQVVIEIPNTLNGDKLERGEEVVLEYTDWGPSGADFVGDEDEDINLTIFTSNFGATVELDQKVYSWTDKVYITIVAPDHNFDSNLIDEIGNEAEDPIKVATRGSDLDPYKLVETGTDTGIFTGEVILTGFSTHDADGDGVEGDATAVNTGVGPTDGFLPADDDDGITVSFEFSEDETVVGSALIRWNIGEVQWLEASYPATGTGVVRVVDPDLNLNPEAVDNFETDVWSDSDAGGIDLTVTETNEATGIFEGTVFFTVADESSGHRLRVAEGDTITAEYEDNTLPDPYTTADELDITGTSIIGTIVPPLERAPASGIRVVDAFGNSLGEISVDQQVQITSDLANGQDRAQAFAYLVQVQDDNGVTVSLAWITGSLTAGQSFSPALSWIPDAPGTYTATAFVWESVDNPTALSPPVKTTVNVI